MKNLTVTNSERAKLIVGSTIAVLVLMMGVVATASASGYAPQRDSAAISTLQNAIAALGGSNAVAGIQDSILTGSITNQNGTNTTFTWTMAGSEFRIEATTAKGGTNVFLSGHGSPAWVLNGQASALNFYMARANPPFYLPAYVLFQESNNLAYTLKYVGPVQLNGNQVIQVHISDDSDPVGTQVTPQEWYFDPVSFLPVRVQYREPTDDDPANYANAVYDMSQFVLVSGVLVPYTISYSDDTMKEVFSVGAVTFNSGVPQSVFDPPQGGGQ